MAISLNSAQRTMAGFGNLSPNNWYRYHGDPGLDDFRKTGQIRANPNGKYNETYFSQGQLDKRYSAKGGGSIVEAHPSAVKPTSSFNTAAPYGTTPSLDRTSRMRVLQRVGETYKPVYDNLTPWKYYGRKALAVWEKAAVPMALADSAVSTFWTPTSQYATRFRIKEPESFVGNLGLRSLGAASDLGNTLTGGLAGKYLYRDLKGR